MNELSVWFPTFRAASNRGIRLFCFPYAGGGTAVYASWLHAAPEDIDVLPAQLPGRELRMGERPPADLHALVQPIADAIAYVAHQPYALFGHSMGAVIAFEVARELRRRACQSPLTLFVSARAAPDTAPTTVPLHRLSDDELLERIKALEGTPPKLLEHPEFAWLFLPILRADFAVVEQYRYTPEPPLDVPISAFGGEDDAVAVVGLDGWRRQTTARFQLRLMPGGHFFLQSARDMMLRAVSEDLHAARR